MTQRSLAQAPKLAMPVHSHAASRVLQRTCDCGRQALGGECESCKKKKLLQRRNLGGRESRSSGGSESGRTPGSGGLRIGPANDAYEREADRVSRTISGDSPARTSVTATGTHMQRSPDEGVAPAEAPSIVDEVLQTPGQGMDRSTRSFMESRFRADFSRVRVHTDTQAGDSARAVNAAAYTVGNHVVFGSGFYTPGSARGNSLLAHELTHVVQQGKAGPRSTQSGATHEGEARDAANALSAPESPIEVRQAAAPSIAPMSIAEARQALWKHVPDSAKEYVRPVAQVAAAQMDRIVPPNTQIPKAVEAVVVRPVETAAAVADEAKQAISDAGKKISAASATASQAAASFSKAAKQKAKEKLREASTGGLGFSKGVVLEVTNAVDAVAWVGQAGHDLAKKAVGDSKAAQAFMYVADTVSGYAALQALADAGLSEIDPFTGKPTGRFALSSATGNLFDKANEKLDATFGLPPDQQLLGFSTYETEEVAASLVVQGGLAFVEVEEVQIVLKVLGVLGSGEAVIKAMEANPKGWHKDLHFWTGIINLVLSLINLRGNIANKIARMALATLNFGMVIPLFYQLYNDYKKPESPERHKALHGDMKAIAGAVSMALQAILHKAVAQKRGAAPERSGTPAEKSSPATTTPAEPRVAAGDTGPHPAPVAKGPAHLEPPPKAAPAEPHALAEPSQAKSPPKAKAKTVNESPAEKAAPKKASTESEAKSTPQEEKTVAKSDTGEPTAKSINEKDAKATAPTADKHKAVVTAEGIGKCSPGPCPLIHVEYAPELKGRPALREWNKRIQKLRKDPAKAAVAAEEGARLINVLEGIRQGKAPSAGPTPAGKALKHLPDPLPEVGAGHVDSASGQYTGSKRLARGNFGERTATDALAADGHKVLSFKPDIAGTNQGGIDMVTMKGGKVYFVDNKALTRSGNVSSVSALTTNFAKNRATVVREFTGYANDPSRTPQERAIFRQAVERIKSGQFEKVVTNANSAPDAQILGGVTQDLMKRKIGFIDVMQ